MSVEVGNGKYLIWMMLYFKNKNGIPLYIFLVIYNIYKCYSLHCSLIFITIRHLCFPSFLIIYTDFISLIRLELLGVFNSLFGPIPNNETGYWFSCNKGYKIQHYFKRLTGTFF